MEQIELNLDYDNLTRKNLFGLLDQIIEADVCDRIGVLDYRKSSGGGYHVRMILSVSTTMYKNIAACEHRGLDMFLLGLRYAYGDCLGRLKADSFRMRSSAGAVMRLFSRKNGKNVGRWVRYAEREWCANL